MSKLSGKKFCLVNLPLSAGTEKVVGLFTDIKRVRKVVISKNNHAPYSQCFASLILDEAIQPYYLPTIMEKVRGKNIGGNPVFILSTSLLSSEQVNHLFNEICTILGVNDPNGFRRAEAITSEILVIEKKVKRVGIDQLLHFITLASEQGKIDLDLVEMKINGFLAAKHEEMKKKRKKKPEKKRRPRSVKAISTPMGGQPEWRRK